jgi:hypothetical protein
VCLHSELQGIQITRGATDTPTDRAVLWRPIEPGEELFTVRSGEGLGWVLARGVHGREGYRDFHAPSMWQASNGLYGRVLEPGERSLFSITVNV